MKSLFQTRKHSSRMRSDHALTRKSSDQVATRPIVNRMIDRHLWKHYLPLRSVKMWSWVLPTYNSDKSNNNANDKKLVMTCGSSITTSNKTKKFSTRNWWPFSFWIAKMETIGVNFFTLYNCVCCHWCYHFWVGLTATVIKLITVIFVAILIKLR